MIPRRLWTTLIVAIILRTAYSKKEHPWDKRTTPITYSECSESVCWNEANDIASSMNLKADPCDDFYEYVCGNWYDVYGQPDPVYRNSPWTVDDMLEFKAFHSLRKKIETPASSSEPEYVGRVKRIYEACMKLPWMGLLDGEHLKSLVSEAGYWPMFPQKKAKIGDALDWVPTHNYYLKMTGESALFSFVISLSPTDKKTSLLQIKKPTSPYGLFIRFGKWGLREMKHYANFLKLIAFNAQPAGTSTVSNNEFQKSITNVIQFRVKIQEILHELTKENTVPMTIDYLQNWYHQKSATLLRTAEIPWLKIIRALYENDEKSKITGDNTILMGYSNYFIRLRGLLAQTSIRTIINHIHLYFIERHLRLSTEQKNLIHATIDLTPATPIAKMRKITERWYSCMEKHMPPDALGKLYAREHFSSTRSHQKLRVLMQEIRNMVKVQIDDSTWLNDKAKTLAKAKIDKIQWTLGYPKWYDEQGSRRQKKQEPSLLPHHPEAKYSPLLNEIQISAAYFQPPVYHEQMPFVANYGALGSMIGHEMYHALDSIGIWHDADGNAKTWWPQDMLTLYNSKKGCYIHQYDQYTVKEVEGIKNAPSCKPPAETTVEEDFADSMGLKAAFEAYRNKLMQEKFACMILPRMKSFSCDQLFFVSFARSYCYSVEPLKLILTMRYDKHNTGRIRVNGAVSNMKEFSEAFQCPSKANLNPKTKCDFWE